MANHIEIGRVLRANTQGYAFGCRATQLEHPRFGRLVKAHAGDYCVYGLIYNIDVADDPLVRRLVLSDNLQPEAIDDQRANRMLPVEISVLSLGYQENGTIRHSLPPRPPLNLDPVHLVDNHASEIADFTDKLTYLRLIMNAATQDLPIDQLLVAHIRDTFALRDNDSVWAQSAIQEVIELLRHSYETLVPTLEALSDSLQDALEVQK